MTSAIDDTKPVSGAPTTASVRANFTTAKSEITNLQADLATETSNRTSAVSAEATARAAADTSEAATRAAADTSLQSQITALGTPVHETKGTWTPVLKAVTLGNWTPTYTTQLGFWHRIGDRIFFDCIVICSAVTHTTASGQIQVGGLPVVAKNTTSRQPIMPCEWDGFSSATPFTLNARLQPNTTDLQFIISNSANSGRVLQVSDHTSGTQLVFIVSGSYEV